VVIDLKMKVLGLAIYKTLIINSMKTQVKELRTQPNDMKLKPTMIDRKRKIDCYIHLTHI